MIIVVEAQCERWDEKRLSRVAYLQRRRGRLYTERNAALFSLFNI